MVAYKGEVNTAVGTGGIINGVLNGLIDARVKVNVENYTILGSELAASTINIGGNLPKGAVVLAIVLMVSAAQSSATFSVGDAGSATRYASAHTGLQTAVVPVVIGGKNYVITGTNDTQIVLTTGGATLSAGNLDAFILYAID
jgi:hypothetical protein